MVLLAINTTIVTTGIVVFLIVILILVGILLFAKAKLTAKGDVKISINNGDRVITTEPGSSLLSTLAGQKIFLPSACGGKGSCGMCMSGRFGCRFYSPPKQVSSPNNNSTKTGVWLVR